MKVFMLGWEYPPNIGGGLGTACQGLTTSLARLGVKIDFVVPRLHGRENAPHMTLIDSYSGRLEKQKQLLGMETNVNTVPVPALLTPYARPAQYDNWMSFYRSGGTSEEIPPEIMALLQEAMKDKPAATGNLYGATLFAEVDRFARNCLLIAQGRKFDLIHAHDWMTYPAGLAVAKLTGKPLVTHVHSLEYDRTGVSVDPQIHEIEGNGVKTADQVIAVSYYTRGVVHSQHRVPLDKIGVVHNGVYAKEAIQHYRDPNRRNKMVLFLGRITYQKGPEYFVEAAARVIPLVPEAVFVMAGSGDMLPAIKRKVREMGLSDHFMFPGFLKGQEVERMYSMADLYIMPSVSEPFGIAPLEAMSHDVPVIISRQSGCSEVLNHALKIDYWDVERMAHLMVGVLRYGEIRDDLIGMAREEIRRIHWDAAAEKTAKIYRELLKKTTVHRGGSRGITRN